MLDVSRCTRFQETYLQQCFDEMELRRSMDDDFPPSCSDEEDEEDDEDDETHEDGEGAEDEEEDDDDHRHSHRHHHHHRHHNHNHAMRAKQQVRRTLIFKVLGGLACPDREILDDIFRRAFELKICGLVGGA